MDQEFIYSYPMLLDQLAQHLVSSDLSPDTKASHLRLVTQLQDTINLYQGQHIELKNGDRDKSYSLPIRVEQSSFVEQSLQELAVADQFASDLVVALKTSNTIYYHHAIGDWWVSNELRTQNFVNNFRSLYNDGGKLSDEKVFFKLGGLHAAKGINGYSKYDIGNLVYETARLTSSKSCHIIVLDRYWKEDGIITDGLSDTTSFYAKNFDQFVQVGSPGEWAIIDLDTIRKQGLYRQDVKDRIREYFERYDYVIITPTDESPTFNARN